MSYLLGDEKKKNQDGFVLFRCFINCGASQAQSEYSLDFRLKPNVRGFIDINEANFNKDIAKRYKLSRFITFMEPRYELSLKRKKLFAIW